MIMADLLSRIPEYRDSSVAVHCGEFSAGLVEHSRDQSSVMFFYMGTDFRKLKAPSSWYDILSVAGVLSNFSFIREDPRFREMISLIKSKQDADGFFTPESIYLKMKDWDFGQKKKPSPYLTYLALRIFARL
jgi:hypothetical protein